MRQGNYKSRKARKQDMNRNSRQVMSYNTGNVVVNPFLFDAPVEKAPSIMKGIGAGFGQVAALATALFSRRGRGK